LTGSQNTRTKQHVRGGLKRNPAIKRRHGAAGIAGGLACQLCKKAQLSDHLVGVPNFRIATTRKSVDPQTLKMWVQLGCDNTSLALLRAPKQANGAVDFQSITSETVAVTAEAAGSSPVVPAILFNNLRGEWTFENVFRVVLCVATLFSTPLGCEIDRLLESASNLHAALVSPPGYNIKPAWAEAQACNSLRGLDRTGRGQRPWLSLSPPLAAIQQIPLPACM